MESDRLECQTAGMNEFLSKPLRKEDLTAAIDRVPKDVIAYHFKLHPAKAYVRVQRV